jgi:beta-xylosidase
MYATSFFDGFSVIDGFYVWVSSDLEHWSEPRQAYKSGERGFGYADFWAPEVVYHEGKFLMHYSARRETDKSLRIGVAIADSPLGPFVDVHDKAPMFDFGYAAIDAHVFVDDDGQAYLYYSRDCSENIIGDRHESHIYAVCLDSSLTKVCGDPVCLLKPEQPWEYNPAEKWSWNEGPYMIKHNGLYYLMYSGNCYATKHYSTGYATACSPMGPFVKASENPILSYVEGKVSGPGHNCLFTSLDGQLLCAYHVHTDYDNPSYDRQMFIDRAYFEHGKLLVEGPTFAE